MMRRRTGNCLVQTAVSVAVLALVLGAVAILRLRAVPWPSALPDVRLDPARPVLADADVSETNAWFYLRQLIEPDAQPDRSDLRAQSDRFLDSGPEGAPYEALRNACEAHASNLVLWARSGDLPFCQVTTMRSFEDTLPAVAPFLALGRLTPYRAWRAAENGAPGGAGRVLSRALRNADHITRGGVLIQHLVSYAATGEICGGIRRLANAGCLSRAERDALVAQLLGLAAHLEPWSEALRYERMAGQAAVRQIYGRAPFAPLKQIGELGGGADGKSWIPAPLQYGMLGLLGSTPASTSRHMDRVYAHLIRLAESARGAQDPELDRFLHAGAERRNLADDPMGRILAAILVPAVQKAGERYRRDLVELNGTACFLAVLAWRENHAGALPAGLAALCPDELPAVPPDPFDSAGGTLRFRAGDGEWAVYSVGPNGRDDDGVAGDDAKQGLSAQGDLVFPCP